ncbi:para-aminobenzoate synthetase component 1 [Ekhidna lutea]|uniref:Para-aminobenzoate synthetase component 1 n=1 Tax=Ekhidna lutea TaxID=447679 RepID=A0A239IXC1_EKHLU|nr:aminodeoxychorismate synthase component I [Ekhidna lutea]SNS98042.1 para-aminobenzoate synthetase component 1 [Ekhidna lutea]
MLTKNEAISRLNELGAAGQPFSFYCDFLGDKWCIEPSEKQNFKLEIDSDFSKGQQSTVDGKPLTFKKKPISLEGFKQSFNQIIHQINIGNSFLTNLTFETLIKTNLSLEEIFQYSQAKYKLHVPNQFVVFSPETFVRINGNHIYSYPMKGTIDAIIPNAEEVILNDIKETAEHVTIVDLIRNDLSQVSEKVEVTKFRYIDELVTNDKKLLQVSSEVKGTLANNWRGNLGTILSKLLPAGSISGAPKPETIKIIQQVESYQRNFYTGICGHFDGESLDTGVMIRFIKKEKDQLIFCSGGGITSFSEAEKEYQEMVDKVYLAI